MANKANLTIGGVVAVLVAAYFGMDVQQNDIQQNNTVDQLSNENKPSERKVVQVASSAQKSGTRIIENAFKNKLSNVQVEGVGKVVAILPDDNEGSRHQKFILELESGQTILIAHNIDLASRLQHLSKGDVVQFFGEYEYSAKGGVVHWTHHDPRKKHPDGWLKHNGKTIK
ncbi:hypothetical protein A6M14_08500 [Acinetobacter sp. Ac_877]|uniref:DUF3465 domain-containing protein n=1 Tax=Acinetobacter portensis TaxID=1839785 RepID=UPI00128E413F|nr:DUF3465 domain-containing protein [Acinetobacter portensis]MPW41479.1 hypothetical protein [Acinetobacter portensis]